MSFWSRLFGKSNHKVMNEFAVRATRGSSACQIAISDWSALYEALTSSLLDAGMTTSQVIHLVREKLIGVCPQCHTWGNGKGLMMVPLIESVRSSSGAPQGVYRLLEGRCMNESCSCSEIMIFWKPDEDRDAIARLERIGINIRTQMNKPLPFPPISLADTKLFRQGGRGYFRDDQYILRAFWVEELPEKTGSFSYLFMGLIHDVQLGRLLDIPEDVYFALDQGTFFTSEAPEIGGYLIMFDSQSVPFLGRVCKEKEDQVYHPTNRST